MAIAITAAMQIQNLAGVNSNMEPWKMLWNIVTGKGEQPTPAAIPESPKPDYLERLKIAESSGQADAKAKTSSATGHHQFIERTWNELSDKYKLNFKLEDRTDPEKSRKVAELYTNENREALKKVLNREPSDTQLYAAHFLGTSGAKKFLTAQPFKLAKDVVNKDQVQANKNIFYDVKQNKPRTVAEVYKVLQKKIGEE
jgi:hypothetical protein